MKRDREKRLKKGKSGCELETRFLKGSSVWILGLIKYPVLLHVYLSLSLLLIYLPTKSHLVFPFQLVLKRTNGSLQKTLRVVLTLQIHVMPRMALDSRTDDTVEAEEAE